MVGPKARPSVIMSEMRWYRSIAVWHNRILYSLLYVEGASNSNDEEAYEKL